MIFGSKTMNGRLAGAPDRSPALPSLGKTSPALHGRHRSGSAEIKICKKLLTKGCLRGTRGCWEMLEMTKYLDFFGAYGVPG